MGRSSVKNSLAVLVRVMEQAKRDGIITVNPARVNGWQAEYKKAEDELDDPRSLALSDWDTLASLADALVRRSHGQYLGWGSVVTFAACTAARIGEVSDVRARDIDPVNWIWTVRRQTTPGPGGLIDKGTKGKMARRIPLIEEVPPPWSPSASWPSATDPTPACSPGRAADASPPPSCGTPPTGTRSSPSSATSTCDATACGTPA